MLENSIPENVQSLSSKFKQLIELFAESNNNPITQYQSNGVLYSISTQLNISTFEALILVVSTPWYIKNESITIEKLINTLDLKITDLIDLQSSLNNLVRKGFLDNAKKEYDLRLDGDINKYTFSVWLISRLFGSKLSEPELNNPAGWLQEFHNHYERARDGLIHVDHFFSHLEDDLYRIPFIQEKIRVMDEIGINEHEKAIFWLVAYDYLSFKESTKLMDMNRYIFRSKLHQLLFGDSIRKMELSLIKEGLIRFVETNFIADYGVTLTKKGVVFFFGEDDKLGRDQINTEPFLGTIIPSKTIKEKPLIFTSSVQTEIQFISQCIQTNGFQNLTQLMKEKYGSDGLNFILYGPSGTGKTELVYQLARESGRDIFFVDLAAIKSPFVGSSERNLKGIFTEYQKVSSKADQIPILFFNEGDAVLNRRIDVRQSTDIMNNNMQGIMLQQLEQFSGICFFATNLMENIDKAMERRFLYKLELPHPSKELQGKIWQQKLIEIYHPFIRELMGRFDFSGAQIENVAKRIDIYQVLNQDQPMSLEEIINICKTEKFKENKKEITGFKIPLGSVSSLTK